jgi:hypothetical protein
MNDELMKEIGKTTATMQLICLFVGLIAGIAWGIVLTELSAQYNQDSLAVKIICNK